MLLLKSFVENYGRLSELGEKTAWSCMAYDPSRCLAKMDITVGFLGTVVFMVCRSCGMPDRSLLWALKLSASCHRRVVCPFRNLLRDARAV